MLKSSTRGDSPDFEPGFVGLGHAFVEAAGVLAVVG